MAWVQADVDALKDALETGAISVQYRDKRVDYRSLAEMRELLAMMKSEVAGVVASSTRRHSLAQFSKG